MMKIIQQIFIKRWKSIPEEYEKKKLPKKVDILSITG